MKWFGPDWHAPVTTNCERAETPTEPCGCCGKAFTPEDRGLILPHYGVSDDDPRNLTIAYHLDCMLRMVGAR